MLEELTKKERLDFERSYPAWVQEVDEMFYTGFGNNRFSTETEQCIREIYGEQLRNKAVSMDLPAILHIALQEKALQTKSQKDYIRFLIARDEVMETEYTDVCIRFFNMEELS